MASRYLRRWRYRLGVRLRHWAERLDPSPPAEVGEPVTPQQIRFRVSRIVRGRTSVIYDGPHGAKARDRVVHERTTRGPGTTVWEFRGPKDDDWHVRETFTFPE